MNNELDVKIYLSLDKVEHQLRKAAYLSTAEKFQKDIYEALDIIVKVKKKVEERLDTNS